MKKKRERKKKGKREWVIIKKRKKENEKRKRAKYINEYPRNKKTHMRIELEVVIKIQNNNQ